MWRVGVSVRVAEVNENGFTTDMGVVEVTADEFTTDMGVVEVMEDEFTTDMGVVEVMADEFTTDMGVVEVMVDEFTTDMGVVEVMADEFTTDMGVVEVMEDEFTTDMGVVEVMLCAKVIKAVEVVVGHVEVVKVVGTTEGVLVTCVWGIAVGSFPGQNEAKKKEFPCTGISGLVRVCSIPLSVLLFPPFFSPWLLRIGAYDNSLPYS